MRTIISRTKGSLSGEEKNKWSAEKWYESSFVATYYMHLAYQKVRANFSILAQQKLEEMIRYQITLWRSYSFDSEVYTQFWKLVWKYFWSNRFIFNYISKKAGILYLLNVIKEGVKTNG